MFSPRAENLAMPGRPPAAPRSRWLKLSVRAIWADQSAATRARSRSQDSAGRPLARRSTFSRSNRSLVSVPAVDWLPAGPAAVEGAAVARGAGRVVVLGARVVVGAAVLVVAAGTAEGRRRGRSASTSAARRAASAAGAAAAAPSRPGWPPAPGLALAGSSAHARASGSRIRKAIRRLPTHGGSPRACRGRALERCRAGSLPKLVRLSEGPGLHQSGGHAGGTRAMPLPCRWPNGGLGGWPTTGVPFQIRPLPVQPAGRPGGAGSMAGWGSHDTVVGAAGRADDAGPARAHHGPRPPPP